MLKKLKVDDPVGAVGVHWAAGCWGMVAIGIFGKKNDIETFITTNGIIHGGSWDLLAANLAAVVSTTLWSGGVTFVTVLTLIVKFYCLKFYCVKSSENIYFYGCI